MPTQRGDEPVEDPNDDEDKPWHTLDEESKDKKKKKRKRGSLARELAIIIACVLLLTFLLQYFFGRQYVIPSESMENTLIGCQGCTNDRIWVDKLTYHFNDPRPGDVVVFKSPTKDWDSDWTSPRSKNAILRGIQNVASWFGFAPPNENDLVKRVIAVGGQTVECSNATGGLRVNGKLLDEPYVDKAKQEQEDPVDGGKPCFGGLGGFPKYTVPSGFVWVMGDNRSESADSRAHVGDEYGGMVPIKNIRGKVRWVIYPFSRFGGVSDHNPQG